MDHFELRGGVLHCEDVPLPTIAAAVETPVYVYSTATMVRHARIFREAVGEAGDPLVAFAVKANPNPAVLATLAAQGLGADVVSGGEYQVARAAGIPADRIVFSGVGKTAAEMERALAGGLFQFNLESVAEADMLAQVAANLGVQAPVAFRINPDVDAGTHAKISTGSARSKFGIPHGDVASAYAHARSLPTLKVRGIAVHIGSQLTSLDPLEAAFRRLGRWIEDLRADGHEIAVADLGGGLGIPYDPSLPHPPSPGDYGRMVQRVTSGWNARLVFEPGRLIVGNAGILLTEVIRLKPGPNHPFVILDAAMNDLMRPSLYDAWHAVEPVVPDGARMVADIVGPVCESGDTFALDREMGRLKAGDLAVFRTCGAYGATMSNTYNSRALTPEVLVSGSEWAIVRPRPDMEAALADFEIPAWIERAG